METNTRNTRCKKCTSGLSAGHICFSPDKRPVQKLIASQNKSDPSQQQFSIFKLNFPSPPRRDRYKKRHLLKLNFFVNSTRSFFTVKVVSCRARSITHIRLRNTRVLSVVRVYCCPRSLFGTGEHTKLDILIEIVEMLINLRAQ